MTQQKNAKSENDPFSLPPVIPELSIQLEGYSSELTRMCNLAWQGYSAIIYAQENGLNKKYRYRLGVAFQQECFHVSSFISHLSQSYESFTPQDRVNLYEECASLCTSNQKLVIKYLLGEQTIRAGTIPPAFFELTLRLLRLFQKLDVRSSIEMDALNKAALEICDKLEKECKVSTETQSNDTNGKSPVEEPPISVKEPSKEAVKAYQLYYGTGKSQTEVAETMTKQLKRPVSQGQISKWANQYKAWAEANGMPTPQKPIIKTVDPDKLDIGNRTDGRRTGDPRHKKKVDPEDADE